MTPRSTETLDREILALMKQSELKKVPIIIMSTSDSLADVEYCYNNGASSYFVKPIDLENYFSSFDIIVKYWLTWAKLPKSRTPGGPA